MGWVGKAQQSLLFYDQKQLLYLEHVELLRRVVVQPTLRLLHPVRCPLHVLDEESQPVQLLLRVAFVGASGKLLLQQITKKVEAGRPGDTVIQTTEFNARKSTQGQPDVD